MIKRRSRCPKRNSYIDTLIGIILIGGGVLLILIYIPIWAWMVLFGMFLVGLGILIVMGRR